MEALLSANVWVFGTMCLLGLGVAAYSVWAGNRVYNSASPVPTSDQQAPAPERATQSDIQVYVHTMGSQEEVISRSEVVQGRPLDSEDVDGLSLGLLVLLNERFQELKMSHHQLAKEVAQQLERASGGTSTPESEEQTSPPEESRDA